MRQFEEQILKGIEVDGELDPMIEFWEDDEHYYHYHRKSGFARKALKSARREIQDFGNWYPAPASQFAK